MQRSDAPIVFAPRDDATGCLGSRIGRDDVNDAFGRMMERDVARPGILFD